MAGIAEGFTPIQGRPAAPPRISLVTSADDQTANLPSHWVNGIAWDPEACLPDTNPVWWWCPITPEADPEHTKVIDDNRANIEYRPFGGWAGDKCSTIGTNMDELRARSLRKLIANESRILEGELWTGAVAQAAGFPNAYLNNSATLDNLGTAGLVYALAALQQYLANSVNERGMIHATVRTAGLWHAAGAIRREGNLLLDPFDNIIVAGQGYNGSGPDDDPAPASGDTAWAYATPIVQIALDRANRRTLPDDRGSVDRDNNTIEFRTEEIMAAWFDVGCAHGGIEVNLCEPCCTPTE